MSLQTYIDPASTKQLLNNLSLAIDETKLIRSIEAINRRINYLEFTDGKPALIDNHQKEIKVMEAQLNYIRDMANFRLMI